MCKTSALTTRPSTLTGDWTVLAIQNNFHECGRLNRIQICLFHLIGINMISYCDENIYSDINKNCVGYASKLKNNKFMWHKIACVCVVLWALSVDLLYSCHNYEDYVPGSKCYLLISYDTELRTIYYVYNVRKPVNLRAKYIFIL